jgi:hypothetical protein
LVVDTFEALLGETEDNDEGCEVETSVEASDEAVVMFAFGLKGHL